jgi:hypothetical protein
MLLIGYTRLRAAKRECPARCESLRGGPPRPLTVARLAQMVLRAKRKRQREGEVRRWLIVGRRFALSAFSSACSWAFSFWQRIASGVVNAFLYTFETGCLALAFVFGVLAIFGHQLIRVSKMPRTQRIGGLTRNCSGTAAILALASFAVDYGY